MPDLRITKPERRYVHPWTIALAAGELHRGPVNNPRAGGLVPMYTLRRHGKVVLRLTAAGLFDTDERVAS